MDKPVLLIASGLLHPPMLAVIRLRGLLTSAGVPYETASSMEALKRLELDRFSALILYFHHKHISQEALRRFEAFVAKGGGVLAIHSATASFKQEPRYFEILGGCFTGHAAVQKITMQPFKSQPYLYSDLFAGIPAFTIEDELYTHAMQTEAQVHFYALHDGERHPMVWTKAFHKGRVCYASPGHTAIALGNLEYQKLLMRALYWAVDPSRAVISTVEEAQ